ncbi:MAG: hypothetical protein P5697_17020 [Limnospira sp. PMC 1256.20]|uniref:hypothetical protein n=2 Tax=unclassified Limnospira TaxID=2642885 RepID=UPI0028E0A682|nr:hypothetical protein [Limnospira sp. PMC 1256.20]MDT9215170.1 hypothetical protein [Limnospira sp. PMC 1256.20]MDT9286583.1 hypothetical protein [Limnospira sp. PMC 1298.21]
MKKISMTIVLVIFCWLNPSYHNQSVLAQTQDQNTPNLPKQENLIQKQSLETQQPKIKENPTQQPEKPEVKKETIDLGVSIGYNTFVVTALALLITILSIVLTISIFILGYLGYSKIDKTTTEKLNKKMKEIEEIKEKFDEDIKAIKAKLDEKIKNLDQDIEAIKANLNADEQKLKTNITDVNAKLGELSEKINGQVSELQKIVSSERDKTENLTKMIDNISDDFKKYIQAEAIKMNVLTMVDHYMKMKNFEQALKEIEDFEKKYLNEKELLKRCKLNRATILCNQEYALNNYDLALKNLEELLDWAEYKIEIYNLIAYCYSQKYYNSYCQETNLIKKAKKQLEQLKEIIAEKNQRENFKLKINLGNCEIHLGDFKAALQYFYDADSYLDGINSQNSPGEFYLWRVGKLICYLSCIEQYKSELDQEFQIFTSNIDEWNEGLRYCKKNFQHLEKYLNKLEEEFNTFKNQVNP